MPRINKTQHYAVLWLESQGWGVSKIADELSLSEKQVSSVIDKLEKNNTGIKTVSSPVGSSPSKSLLIRETAGKKQNVTIMTKESSMLNDDAKKNSSAPVRNNTGIYRPNDR